MSETERSYIAFISYRHMPLDKEAAGRIQKKIENYVIPKEFRTEGRGKKLGTVFRDEDELPASSSLTDSIYYALDHAQFLIVVCTPDLPLSRWCEAEIRYFLETHDRDHLLAVLADGTPAQSFSPWMLHDFDEEGNITASYEPLAANIAGRNHSIDGKAFKKEIVRICAALLGCPFDALWQRERRARTNRLLTAAAAAMAVMAVFLGVVLDRNARIREQNDQILEQNTQIQAQNDRITEQYDRIVEMNGQIEEQNRELQSRLSSVRVDSGLQKLNDYDLNDALEEGLAALESGDPEIYDHRAEKLLADAMDLYRTNALQSRVVYEQSTDITEIFLSEDGTRLYLLDQVGTLRCLDASGFTVRWEAQTGNARTCVYPDLPDGRVLCKNREAVSCFSASDGSLLWSRPMAAPNNMHGLSADGTVLAVLDAIPQEGLPDYQYPSGVCFLDTGDGHELGRTLLEIEDRRADAGYLYGNEHYFGCSFSPDGKTLACAVPLERTDDKNDGYLVCTVDTGTYRMTPLETMSIGVAPIIYGFDFPAGTGDILLALYSPELNGIFTTLYRDGSGADPVVNRIGYSPNAYGGTTDYGALATFGMQTADDFDLIRTTNQVFFTDKESTSLTYFNFPALVRNVYRAGPEETYMYIVLADGRVTEVLRHEDGSHYRNLEYYLDVSGILRQVLLDHRGDDPLRGARYLSVTEGAPQRLLLTEFTGDPSVREISFPGLAPEKYSDLTQFYPRPVPDSNSLLVFGNSGQGTSWAARFDAATGEELERFRTEEQLFYSVKGVQAMSGGRFLYGSRIFSMDGTTEPLEDWDTDSFSYLERYLSSLPAADGRVLTILPRRDSAFNYGYPAWLDGKRVRPSDSSAYSADLAEEETEIAGRNGIITIFAALTADPSATKYYWFDAVSGGPLRAFTDSPQETRPVLTVSGTARPLLAVSREDGSVRILDLDREQVILPECGYASREILSMGFSEGDDCLAVLTAAGRLDLYEARTGRRVFSETPEVFKDHLSFLSSTSSEHVLEVYSDPERRALCVFASLKGQSGGHLAVLDTDSMTIRAEIENIHYIDRQNGRYYVSLQLPENGVHLLTCDIRSTEDLRSEAQARLAP